MSTVLSCQLRLVIFLRKSQKLPFSLPKPPFASLTIEKVNPAPASHSQGLLPTRGEDKAEKRQPVKNWAGDWAESLG